MGGQIGQLRLFALHEKSLGPKIKTWGWSEPKLEKQRFYHHFGRVHPSGRQLGFLKLFALHEKSLDPKIKTLAWSEQDSLNNGFTAVLAGYASKGS